MTTPIHHRTHGRRGSALGITMLLVFALTLIVGAILRTLVLDKRLNAGYAIAGEARNAAEGAAEVAVAELNRRAAAYSSLGDNPLDSFTFPEDARTFLGGGNIVSGSIAFKAGQLSPMPANPVIIDGSDPFNALDIDKGKAVMIRNGYIYGKASARDPVTGRIITHYVSNLVQVREQTWLNYAVFYNLDMEMHSGSTMELHGPVHTNQNAYLTAGSGRTLEFYGSFTTAKRVFRKYKYGGVTVSHNGTVLFADRDNPESYELVSMATNQDSTKSNFKTFAEARWNGFVQDRTFQVPVIDPPDLPQYTPDDPATTSVNEMRNSAYAMIEPQLSVVGSDNPANREYRGYKGDTVENLKFSALAGLTIRIRPVNDATNPWTTPASLTDVPGGFDLIYYEGSTDPNRPVNRNNLPARYSTTKRPVAHHVDLDKMTDDLRRKLNDAIRLVRYAETGSGSDGNRPLLGTDIDPGPGTQYRYGIYDRRQGYQKKSYNHGFKGAHHTVQIDLGKFKEFLNAPGSEWVDRTDASKKVYVPDRSWSGVLYVEFPLVPDSDPDVSARFGKDNVRPARAPTVSSPGYAVILRNGKTLPTMPSDPSRRDDGFTFATNGPVYIMGDYNADGLSSTGSATEPDTTSPAPPNNPEVPALIAADAVTLLSANFDDADMQDSWDDDLNNATFTEISTAIITGIVPTKVNASGNGQDNQWAGGVHNFVRFLEDWSGDTYRYRGSIVSLFESEVSKGPWYQHEYEYWYNFPARDIGYHQYFAGGKFPPGLPVLRTVRRISVADITEDVYNAAVPTPPSTSTGS